MSSFGDLFSIPDEKKSSIVLKEAKSLTDEELVERIKESKNQLLFGVLYERFSKKVYSKCYDFVKNEDEAEDLSQDIFMKLYTKLEGFQGRAKFSTWLYAFTYNFCINFLNRDKNKKLTSFSEKLKNKDYEIVSEELELDEDFFEIKLSKLEKALEMIAPEDKALLMLKYHDNIPVKELQTLFNINESALKMRLKRARIKAVKAHDKLT
ncbi:RNA polymerase sigma factor [Aquimarina algicola]|uniref:RNA polymerase sigma factor n=1 Tax=Aquimarina algicola TaxID=2589995 RepID=A0A504JH13_9FLAO|nr:RNA polymerase sigma factor [Aquimarina algicola]TPN87068.1 RNA polymerase sigma factor [Aquimarina algicola]